MFFKLYEADKKQKQLPSRLQQLEKKYKNINFHTFTLATPFVSLYTVKSTQLTLYMRRYDVTYWSCVGRPCVAIAVTNRIFSKSTFKNLNLYCKAYRFLTWASFKEKQYQTLLIVYDQSSLSDLFDLALTFSHKSPAVFVVYKQL